ncbi:uncharacterized protein LOC116319484 [Oreochromis aureus]|uniref:uncharacterized protein LOC116319484 n=1 Tax=Oreochromis aureus TaxID=47969 RepID=UPI0019547BD3|nr:uncharacterized protein LOC116319484 [Oreochromis aureus]
MSGTHEKMSFIGQLLYNLALKQTAVQSSTSGTVGIAGKAVDGNRDANYQSGSCTLTNVESDPWWRVDLVNVYTIGTVMITNRQELENGLDGAEIWIGNSTAISNPESIRCAVISHIPSGQAFYFPCNSMKGRYVTVFLPGSAKVLSLCEVEVYYGYPLPNVALKGEATQSSTLSLATASKAIDGRRNSFYSDGFCSHTAEDETNPWWRVDLQRSFTVTAVKVTNRGDCCAERLDGAEIRIGNSLENNGNNNPRCASISHINAGKTYTYQCDGGSMEGRFVNVFLPGQKKTLTLCEVEVYAAPAVEPLPNVALNKQTVQSSTWYGPVFGPSKGVDGCRNGNFNIGCCTHNDEDLGPWWRVDLLAVYKVSAVTIINRQDCCPERILGAEIRIGNSLDQNGNQNPSCGMITSLAGTPTYTFQCNEMEGRYVIVIIPGKKTSTTLCEVEVFASLSVPEAVTPLPTPPPPLPPVSLQLGGRNVTVVGERLCWSDALMYCRRYYWDLLSLHSQQEQSELEQLLGLIPFSLTDHVWLGLRRSLRGDEWFWMSGYSMNFLNFPQDFVPDSYSSTCGGVASTEHFLWQDQPCEENLNFICQSGADDGVQRVYFSSTKDPTSPCQLLYNLALKQKAVQSSTSGSVGIAGKAVDGNRDANYQSGSCTLTNVESDPWWRVDLVNVYTIGTVMITNRQDLENGLDGAEIWIGNSTTISDPESIRCAVISHISKGQAFYFPCNSMKGRYVTVFLPGSAKVLSLCEVEVYYGYPLPNVALKGEATQSSTLSVATASKAIDGRRNSFYSNGFCSHTAEDETNPWWRVDLQRSFTVTAVKVTNRGDCCAERLDGAEIRIGNSLENNGNNNPRCASISHINAGKTYTYQCDGGSMEGRFVNVFLPGQKKTLTLCEVEVYAAPAVEPLPNVALKKQTVQSSTWYGPVYGPSKGVDGCRNGNLNSGCCTHNDEDLGPWWRVDLLAVYKVSAVTIINRQDGFIPRILGAQILIGNSLEQNGNQNPSCGMIKSLDGTPTYTFQCNEMEGRYIIVIIPGKKTYTTLCEVEVFASLSVPEAVTPLPTPPPPPPPVSLQLGGRNVTVVGERLCWSDALMYCRRYYWDLLSLHSQQEQSELEQLLGLIPFSLTDHVWLGLRRSLRGDEWFWMSGYSMNFLNFPQDFVPDSYSSTCGGVASTEHFLWQDQPCPDDGVQRVYFSSTKDPTSP